MIIDCKSIAQKYKDMAKAKINRMWNEKIITKNKRFVNAVR